MVHGLDIRVALPGILAVFIAAEFTENEIFVYGFSIAVYTIAHLICGHFEKKACLAEEEQSEV